MRQKEKKLVKKCEKQEFTSKITYPPESEANIKVANYIVRFLGLGYQKIKINVGEDSGKYGTFLVNVP